MTENMNDIPGSSLGIKASGMPLKTTLHSSQLTGLFSLFDHPKDRIMKHHSPELND
jgi:hypothetical protein